MNEVQQSNQQPAQAEKPHRAQSEQDQREANRLGDIGEMIKGAQADTEIVAFMLLKGYNPARYAAGLAAVQAVIDARSGRQVAIGTGEGATGLLHTDREHEETAYVDFREDARAEYPGNDAVQTALGIKGEMPRDFEKFIAAARVSYKAAKLVPYSAVLTDVGYDPVTLDADLAHLDALEGEAAGRTGAKGAGPKATSDRETTYTTAQAWASRFTRMAKRQLKARPDLRTKLKI